MKDRRLRGRINARIHGQAAERFLLVLVLAAAAADAVAPTPIRRRPGGNGIDAALAVLAFAPACPCPSPAWRRIAVVLLVSTADLPALAREASLLIAAPEQRPGMQSTGRLRPRRPLGG
jgi:hypothetical protein